MYAVLRARVEELLAIGGPSLQKTVHSGPVGKTVKIRGLNPQAMLETKRLLDRAIKGERFVETLGGVRCVPVWSPFFAHRYFDAYAAELESWIGKGHFTLNCLTSDCATPVSMTELSTVLGDGFLPLMRLALDEHVNTHAESLQFCITPDCLQVYALDGERIVYCSTCAVSICTCCHVEEHVGLTRAE
jgi:hypothetical protein